MGFHFIWNVRTGLHSAIERPRTARLRCTLRAIDDKELTQTRGAFGVPRTSRAKSYFGTEAPRLLEHRPARQRRTRCSVPPNATCRLDPARAWAWRATLKYQATFR